MPPNDAEARSPADLVPRFAAIMHSEGFPNGDRARLKRMGVAGATPLAYHRFLLRHIPEKWQGKSMARGWRTLISGLAAQHQNPHLPEMSFGRALAECRYSEMRLESLLAAEGRVLATLSLRATTLLAAKRVRCNWRDVAGLLFAFNDEAREGINRRIARDYYRTATATETETADSD